jgi:hypothetical protein
VSEVASLGAICSVELAVDVPEVELHRLLGDPKLRGNVSVRSAGCNMLQN